MPFELGVPLLSCEKLLVSLTWLRMKPLNFCHLIGWRRAPNDVEQLNSGLNDTHSRFAG